MATDHPNQRCRTIPQARNPNRNLIRKSTRPIQARFVVDLGYGTARLTIPLNTSDWDTARERRDVAEATLIRAARAYQGLLPD